jgi:peptidyl-prolyl cis-trans isomerase D
MANEIKEPEQKVITKKHIARIEKEKRQRRILLISIISILVVIVLVIVYGVLSKTVLLAVRPVAKINSETISVDQYQKRVKYERLTLEQTFLRYETSTFAQFFQSQLLDVQNRLDDYLTFGGTVLDNMITESLIVQNAKELGITVSEDEISKELEKNFDFFPNGTSTPTATYEYRPTSTYSATQLSLITLTPVPTEIPAATEVPATATPEVTASTTVGTEQPSDVATNTPTATEALPTNTPTTEPTATEIPPTATPYTREGYDTLYSTVVANFDQQINFGATDLHDFVRTSLYSQKLYDLVNKDFTVEQDMVWARHILVATEEDANLVLEKLKAGEDFSTLAAYYSKDTSNSGKGGDLGWQYRGQMVKEFEDAAWALDIGEISQPVKTSFGYHIIQVLGHEVRQLTPDEFNTAKSTAFQKYLDDLNSKATIKKYDIWASVVPSEPSIPTEYRIATPAAQ